MKLLFVIKSLASPGGGAERVLADLTAELSRRGHRITVASYDERGASDFYEFQPEIERLRLAVGRSDRPAGILETLRRMGAIRRLATESRPDVAIGFMHSAYLPLGAALAGTGIPVVASEHIVFDHYRDKPVQAALLNRLAPMFASITALSERVIASYPPRVRQRMRPIPNPVAHFARAGARPAGTESGTILSVGRLTAQKDQATLVEAFSFIASQFPTWRLRIVGEGELRGALERQVEMLGLADRIALPGSLADIGREYAEADLFVMPSRYESFGLATAEALSAGLPVIGFADCPGTNELIENGVNGLLAAGEPRARALADAIARLIDDDTLRARLAANGPTSVAHFSVEGVAESWEKLLLSLAKARPAPAGRDA